ncbi:MAG: FAD-binding oxidoreductase [Sphingomonas sp.]|nr:FAD-binding oxidoreductase [Sphingomonas sp.]
MKRRTLLIGASVIGVAAVGTTVALEPLGAEPEGEKDCGDVLPGIQPPHLRSAKAQVPEPRWEQKGGSVNDASCVDRTPVAGIIAPTSEREIQQALAYATAKGQTISPAGVRHSMGGHAFRRGGLMLDMRRMNAIRLDPEKSTVTVGSGATWHDIQNAIHPRFAVKAMQSTDIFSVGGSISVNAHGMDHQAGAIRESIRSLRVMLADGSIVTTSRTENSELFDLVVGGYGLFGVILSAELDVVPNAIYRSERELIPTSSLPDRLAKIIADPSIGLMYTHISTAPGSLLDEALIYTYHKTDDAGLERARLGEVGSVKFRRLTVHLAKRSTAFRSFKWWAEKNLEHRFEACTVTRAQAMKDGEACLVSRNDPMHDSVPYLRNALKNDTDILQEYFIPRDRLLPFIEGLRNIVRQHDANLLNASVRVVGKEDNRLSYAPEAAYSVVLYFNQRTDADGNARMARLTSDLIDLTQAQGGRFFLPYQLYYSPQQLAAAYPEVRDVFAAKRKWDPDGRFSNTWYERYAPAIG